MIYNTLINNGIYFTCFPVDFKRNFKLTDRKPWLDRGKEAAKH